MLCAKVCSVGLKPSHPILYMTLLVKNEEELLEQNLIFHKQMGVDGFIVTDNNSTDHTPDILRKYKELGWIKEIIQEVSNRLSPEKMGGSYGLVC